jgi:hypothetical protein
VDEFGIDEFDVMLVVMTCRKIYQDLIPGPCRRCARQMGKSITLNFLGTFNVKLRICSAEVVNGFDVASDGDVTLAVPFWGREASLAAEVTFSAFVVTIGGAEVEAVAEVEVMAEVGGGSVVDGPAAMDVINVVALLGRVEVGCRRSSSFFKSDSLI